MTDQITGILALVGVLTGVTSLIISIIAVIRTNYDRIRGISGDSVESFKRHDLDNRIHLKFNEMYNKKMANEPTRPAVRYINETVSNPQPADVVNPSPSASQVAQQSVPAAPNKEETPALVAPATEVPKEEGIELGAEIKLETPITLYASIYRDKAFKKVSKAPDDYTIYNITTSPSAPSSGVITIDLNAYAKVGTTPEFLDEACLVSGNGSNVKVIKPGTVAKDGENWIVTEQIEVELN